MFVCFQLESFLRLNLADDTLATLSVLGFECIMGSFEFAHCVVYLIFENDRDAFLMRDIGEKNKQLCCLDRVGFLPRLIAPRV